MSEETRDTDRLLGQLIAVGEEHKRQLSAVFTKLDQLSRDHQEMAGVAKEGLRLSMETSQELRSAIRPALADLVALRGKGLAVLSFIALLGAGTATGIQKAISIFHTGGGSPGGLP